MSEITEILHYWFGESADEVQVLADYGKLWFGKDQQVDRDIAQRFGALVEQAGQHGLLDGDEPVAQRYLATILLLDQFRRNIYRGQAACFAQDSVALALALKAISAGYDRQLRPIERVFVYLPLEHSEQLEQQDRCVGLFTRLRDSVPAHLREHYSGFLDYAVRHQQIIARFGRFPHRNKMLGRTSTAEEALFLLQPNSSF